MRYTEKDHKVRIESLSDFIKVITLDVIISPFRLINEITLKVMYLRKDLIEKLLLTSALVGIVSVVITFILQVLGSGPNLYYGQLPPIIRIGSCVLLLIAYVVYSNVNEKIVINFDDLLESEKDLTSNNAPIRRIERRRELEDEQEEEIVIKKKGPIISNKELFEASTEKITLENIDKVIIPRVSSFELNPQELQSISALNKEIPIEQEFEQSVELPINSSVGRNNFINDFPVAQEIEISEEEEETLESFINPDIYYSEPLFNFQNKYVGLPEEIKKKESIKFNSKDIDVLKSRIKSSKDNNEYVTDAICDIFDKVGYFDDLDPINSLNFKEIPGNMSM